MKENKPHDLHEVALLLGNLVRDVNALHRRLDPMENQIKDMHLVHEKIKRASTYAARSGDHGTTLPLYTFDGEDDEGGLKLASQHQYGQTEDDDDDESNSIGLSSGGGGIAEYAGTRIAHQKTNRRPQWQCCCSLQ